MGYAPGSINSALVKKLGLLLQKTAEQIWQEQLLQAKETLLKAQAIALKLSINDIRVLLLILDAEDQEVRLSSTQEERPDAKDKEKS